MKGKVRWIGNPLADVVRCFRKLYPHLSADIAIQPVPPELKGQCSFGGEDHPVPLVCIDPMLPYVGCVDVLAHELAHVAAGANGGHGPEWKAAYDAIHAEYFAFIQRAAKRAGVESVALRIEEENDAPALETCAGPKCDHPRIISSLSNVDGSQADWCAECGEKL